VRHKKGAGKAHEREPARRYRGPGRGLGRGLDWRQGCGSGGTKSRIRTQVMVQSILAIAFAEAIVFYTLFLVK